MKTIPQESQELLDQSQDFPIRLRAYVLATSAKLDALKATITDPEQLTLLAKVESELSDSLSIAHQNEAMVNAMCALVVRLVEQYKSANESYNAGWNTRLDDVLAQLSNSDADALRKRIKAMDKRDTNYF